MPELPEVQTVVTTLLPLVKAKKIKRVNVYLNKLIKTHQVDEFGQKMKGQTINDLTRQGKHIIFVCDDYVLISHLRMEGKYYFFNNIKDVIKIKDDHILCQFIFSDQSCLVYYDTRRFGTMHLLDKVNYQKKYPLVNLGPEPWDKKCSPQYLHERLSRKKIAIKSALLDQNIMAGLGNIYVNEVLWFCRINPLQASFLITLAQCEDIINYASKVMKKAIKLGGSSISSYTSSLGVDGKFQNHLMVHTRVGKKCFNCHSLIVKIKVNGRGTYYCEKCQK